MLRRERIVQEIERRMSNVIGTVFRNPDKVPSKDDLPLITIIELDNTVDNRDTRGGKPRYRRTLKLVIEMFVKGSSDDTATKELMTKFAEMRKELYADPVALGLQAVVTETGDSRVYRPESGSHIAGIGSTIEIQYAEDTANL